MSRRRSFGAVRKLPSGRFQARYTDQATGERVTLGDTFTSEKSADRALAKVQTELDQGRHVHPKDGKGTLADLWADYSATKTDRKATTWQDRESLWRHHVDPAFGRMALRNITTNRVRSWHAALHAEHPATAQGAYRLLRQVLNAAVEDSKLAVNPCKVKGAGVDEAPERQIATLAEVEAIVDAMPERMRLVVLLATWAGLR